MKKTEKVFVAAHRGMTGAALVRRLEAEGYSRVLRLGSGEDELTDQASVRNFFLSEKPDYVFLPSVRTGGIQANSLYPAEFIYQNLVSQANVIHSARESGVKKLLFLGSSCIYPKDCPQPIKEEYLLTGKLEPSSEAYATAKISGIRMCQAYNRQYGTRFISAVPADVYGPGDDFDPETGHVLAALIGRMHRAGAESAEHFTVWGTGAPRRETLHVDDLADACLFLMDNYIDSEIINIGSGEDASIREIAETIKEIAGYRGELVFDKSRPDGTPRKLLDNSRIKKLGWTPRISPGDGIRQTYKWYVENIASNKSVEMKR